MTSDPFWDDLFHASAWAAFIELAAAHQRWPDSEDTRRLAYRLYEEALVGKNGPCRPHDEERPSFDKLLKKR